LRRCHHRLGVGPFSVLFPNVTSTCEVFNNYILEAREMPVLSMLETMKCKLMTRFYNKEKEVGQDWYGVVCPKIRKKLQKNMEWANTCYALPARQGIFQVQDRDYSFRVDLDGKKECKGQGNS
jgi:hypothetical protein